ncbi:alpha/beta-hydrolase [Lepidopterella palustris CBS 459.81]|uniref:Alpha/beta-hydrolase n=1 Tax=Lepidopterella palustris CBS 459.81 TaxID=1314670 RepID=A0A8E2E1N7_9PEZI|nr:alpha/beta-hydrolase [Lepidopterella palustris CBS 459.81]
MPMTTAALVQHPEYKHIVWDLQPTEQGKASVGQGRGGPFNISYEVHGHGNRHLVWIMGLGAIKSAWQRQTKDFAHTNGDKYSSLIFDNRGMGESDMPLMRYSTSEMAKDTIELLNHVGWTRERQLHIIGISMGGMIAQEMGFFENLLNRINIFIPRSLDAQLAGIKHNLYTSSYLLSPDSTECVVCPFPTNGDRFAASEVAKRTHPAYSRVGFFAQAIAAGWHWKSEEQLREIGERVGKRRIMVVHGGLDRMIGFEHAKVLWRGLEGRAGVVGEIGREGEGGEEGEVEKHFVMEQGHVIPAEMRKEFMGWVEGLVDRGERMNLM